MSKTIINESTFDQRDGTDWSKAKLGAESKAIAKLNPIDQIKETAIKAIEAELDHFIDFDLDMIIEEAVYKAYGQAIVDMATEIGTVTNKLIERTTE